MEIKYKKAIKRAIGVEFLEITQENVIHLHNFDDRLGHINSIPFCDTIEGTMKGKIGDYVIKGIRGELYICDREIFKETYNEV